MRPTGRKLPGIVFKIAFGEAGEMSLAERRGACCVDHACRTAAHTAVKVAAAGLWAAPQVGALN